MQLQAVILIIIWANSVYLAYDLGKRVSLKQNKRPAVKKIFTESENSKRIKQQEERFWHFDGSNKE